MLYLSLVARAFLDAPVICTPEAHRYVILMIFFPSIAIVYNYTKTKY